MTLFYEMIEGNLMKKIENKINLFKNVVKMIAYGIKTQKCFFLMKFCKIPSKR